MVVDVWLELQLQQIFPDPLDVLALIRTQLLDSLDDFHVAVDHLGHVAVASVLDVRGLLVHARRLLLQRQALLLDLRGWLIEKETPGCGGGGLCSAVSKPILATKFSLVSIFRDLDIAVSIQMCYNILKF